jgi:energy-coupling factor transport system ATP-binding protein
MTALSLQDVRFSYDGKRNILDGLSLEVEPGEAAAITGASGSGKSTLAMAACGVIPKSVHGEFSGSVFVFGEDIKDKRIFETASNISMVFQEPESQLFAPSVIDEAAFAPENLCFPKDSIISSITDALKAAGMQGLSEYSPNTLSSGQQQLAALAAILSLDPQIIILDEAAAQIDEAGVKLIRGAVKELKKRGKTVIVIEHGNDIKDLCDIVYRMENGRLVKV